MNQESSVVDVAKLKEQAAVFGVSLIESGMIVGLGHGSTALYAVREIARKLQSGELTDILGIPCSREIEAEARALGIPLTSLDEHPVIDLTIDGADEVAPNLDVIKGGGGALLREKIVAQASKREVIIVDESKISPCLGTNFAVPVEVIPFGWRTQQIFLEKLGAKVSVRRASYGKNFITDHGNIILDCAFGPIQDPKDLSACMLERAGIVEHGLFISIATEVVIAGIDGIKYHRREEGPLPAAN